jgi:hypothetical protein
MSEIVAKAYALDLDGTTYQTDRAFDKMAQLAIDNSLTTAEMVCDARASVEATRRSFDLMRYLAECGVPQDEINELQLQFGNNVEGDDFLYPDARLLYDALRDTGTPYFTYTKGGWSTQIAKLRSCGLFDSPYLITDNIRKGEDITAMKVATGLYVVNAFRGAQNRVRLIARSIFLLEDKPVGFYGLPDDCDGVLVRRPGPTKITQQGIVPARISVIPDLAAVVERVYQNAK